MIISIISDTHFGFASGSEREEDAFKAAKEAFDKAMDSDIILLAGDLFDSRNPDAETLSKAMEIFIGPVLSDNRMDFVSFIGNKDNEISEMNKMGIPIVSIHGTHERRVRGLINPVQALEKAGFLIHLHCNGVTFSKGKEKICIQGMSGVPEQYSESVLKEWNPDPEAGCLNIFMLHQNITEFLYAKDTLDLNKLPKGFDLYVNGHIHLAREAEYEGRPFLLTGSTIPTQQKKEEARKRKGFWRIETENNKIEKIDFVELENQRNFYFIEPKSLEDLEREMEKVFHEDQKGKPLIRVKLSKELEKSISDIERRYSEKALISFRKESVEVKELPTKTLEEHKLSVEELGRKILQNNLKEKGLDPQLYEQIFELLAEKKSDEAIDLLMKSPGGKTPENGVDNTAKKQVQRKLW